MQYVKLLNDTFVGNRTRSAGEVLPFDDKVADMYVRGKHGVIVPAPMAPVEQATVAPGPESATGRRQRPV